MNTISIITIVRNDKSGIQNTMLSVLSQSFEDYEYIIKDGNSDDGTSELIKKMISEKNCGSNIKYVRCSDKGIYDAMNQAIDLATGKWIIFMNSGDSFVDQNVLSRIYTNEFNGVGMICGHTVTKIGDQLGLWKADTSDLSKKFPCCHQSCIFLTEFVKNHKFNLNYKISADFNMVVDFYVQGGRATVYDGLISCYSLEGISANKFIDRANDYFKIREEHGFQDKVDKIWITKFVAFVKERMCDFFPMFFLIAVKKKYASNKYGVYKVSELNTLYGVQMDGI